MVMVMLDLQKAIDLVYKLKAVGFSDLALKWVGSYLENRIGGGPWGYNVSTTRHGLWGSSRECCGTTFPSFINK